MIKLKLLITVFVLFNFKNHVAIIVQSNISAAVKPIPPPTIIRIGGLFSRLNQVGQVYELGQYTLAAFLLAIEEINNSTTILKSIKLEYAVEDCYLSSSAAITETVNLITQVFGSKGVKAFIGPDVSTEAIASASVAASFQTVQVSSSATSSALSNSLSYPYFTRTCPSDVYQAKAMASLVCQYGWRNIVTFASSDYYGTAGMASFLSEFASQCSPNRVLVSVTVDINAPVIDAPSVVSLIKLQARIFVLFMSANSASSILNEGFNSGLFFQGCQIIGSDAMMGPEVYQSIQPSNIPIFLKGMLGFIPTVSYTSPIAQQFLQNMRALPNTIFPNNECSTATDGNGQSLYLEPTSLYNNNSFTCTGLNISSILPDGSNLTPFAAYAYDAVYLLAYGLDYVTNHRQSLSTGQNLYNALINKISFEGATGFVNLVSTANNDTMLGPGDRETGIAYSLLVRIFIFYVFYTLYCY